MNIRKKKQLLGLLKQYKKTQLDEKAIYKSPLKGFKVGDKVSVDRKVIRKFQKNDTVRGRFRTHINRMISQVDNSFIITELWTLTDYDDPEFEDRAQIQIHGYEDLNRSRWYVPLASLKKR